MLIHNPLLSRIELNHPSYASRSDVKRLMTVLALEKARVGATRAVLRVLTEGPAGGDGFDVEATKDTPSGTLAFFGSNDRCRRPDPLTIARERSYIASVLASRRLPVPGGLEIVRLEASGAAAGELESVYSRTYRYYPEPLDRAAISRKLSEWIPYAVVEGGRIVSALFGAPFSYGPLTAVEFTLCATKPSADGIGMTAALARRIRSEALSRFGESVMVAETIAAPVMRSCHSLGMEVAGVLPEHYRMSVGNRAYTNLYAWFL